MAVPFVLTSLCPSKTLALVLHARCHSRRLKVKVSAQASHGCIGPGEGFWGIEKCRYQSSFAAVIAV